MAESKKSKKHGRNKEECKEYRSSARREINKATRLIKAIHRNPTDKNAIAALGALNPLYQKAAHKKLVATGYKYPTE